MDRRRFLRYSTGLVAVGLANHSWAAELEKPARVGHYQRIYDGHCKTNRAKPGEMAGRGGETFSCWLHQHALVKPRWNHRKDLLQGIHTVDCPPRFIVCLNGFLMR